MDRQHAKILLLVGGGAVAATAAYLGRKQLARIGTMAIEGAKKLAFQGVIPAAARQYSEIILAASAAENVNPFVTVALGDRETLWGTASAYKQQTGDWTMRVGKWLNAPGVRIVQTAPAGWAYPKVKDATGKTVNAPGPYAIPEDGLGWGRGLMQIDWGSERSWLLANDWRNPEVNVKKGLQILKAKLRYLQAKGVPANDLIPAGLAAYNAGEGTIWAAYKAGGIASIDKYTTQGYATAVLGKIAALTSAFEAATGEKLV